jgi:hypothetical protein
MLRARVYHSPSMRHSVRVRVSATLACVAGVAGLPGFAHATTSNPLHVDPKSPVAKEYALPLASARGAAPESDKSGKLFGAGITARRSATKITIAPVRTSAPPTPAPVENPEPAQTPEPAQSPGPARTSPAAPPTVTKAAAATPRPKPRPRVHAKPAPTATSAASATARATQPKTVEAVPSAYKVLRPGTGSGVLWMALTAIVVVVLGGAGGVALSRRR